MWRWSFAGNASRKLEERAHKLGAKLLIPMVIFLLPCMGIILGASSFLRLIDAFKGIH